MDESMSKKGRKVEAKCGLRSVKTGSVRTASVAVGMKKLFCSASDSHSFAIIILEQSAEPLAAGNILETQRNVR